MTNFNDNIRASTPPVLIPTIYMSPPIELLIVLTILLLYYVDYLLETSHSRHPTSSTDPLPISKYYKLAILLFYWILYGNH